MSDLSRIADELVNLPKFQHVYINQRTDCKHMCDECKQPAVDGVVVFESGYDPNESLSICAACFRLLFNIEQVSS